MLVDGSAGLNLNSIKLMEKFQISKKVLTPAGAFLIRLKRIYNF
jgi:hypothetical protein